jgi:hypothetical protein
MNKLSCNQLHYTSCRYGLSGHAGFQTRAMSSSIRPEEQRVMERLGIYQPPRNCPMDPNQEQLDEMFPIAYRNTYLETGKLVVLRSVYVGRDYTGRKGNYFAHALLVEKLPTTMWPVDLYEWCDWKGKLKDGEDIEQSQFNLPILSIYPNETAYSFENLQEFLQEDDRRSKFLAQMIQAVLLRFETSRSLVIREDMMSNCSFWIACIQKSFPATSQQRLSCSSYQFDPRACLAVNAIYGETDFSLGENERKYQFYVFDFITNVHSYVGDAYSEYATTISTWMYQQPEQLELFYGFSSKFEFNSLSAELIIILRLYRISIGESLSLSDDKLMEIIEFINLHGKEKYLSEIRTVVSSVISKLSSSNNNDHIYHLIVFLVNGTKENDSYDIREKVYKLILMLFNNVVFSKEFSITKLKNAVVRLEEVRLLARNCSKLYDREFSKLFLSEQNLLFLHSNVNLLNNTTLIILMKEMILSISFLSDKKEPFRDRRLCDFIAKVIMVRSPDLSSANWLFYFFSRTLNDSASFCVDICMVLNDLSDYKKITDDDYDRAIRFFSLYLSGLLKSKEKKYYFDLINLIKQNPAAWILIYKEWQCSINDQKDKILFHSNYDKYILRQNSDFSEEYRREFAESLWEILSDKEKGIQAKIWIESNYIKCFSKSLLYKVFNKASENISFDPNDFDSNELFKLLVKKTAEYSIEPKPNRLVLRQAVHIANNKAIHFDEQSLMVVKNTLFDIDLKTYEEFIITYLPSILTKVGNSEQHGVIIKFIFKQKFSDGFLKSYRRFFEYGEVNKFNNSEQAALQFWILSDSCNAYEYIYVDIINMLASRLAKLEEPVVEELLANFSKENLTSSQRSKLHDIFKKAEGKKNTFWRKLVHGKF